MSEATSNVDHVYTAFQNGSRLLGILVGLLYEETDNFCNTIIKILEKQTHYTIVMGDFNAKVGRQTNISERATGCFDLGQRNERGDTLVEVPTSKNFKIMNTQFQKKAGRRWTWRSPDGNTKHEVDYIMTDKPSMVTDVTMINR